jgi:ACS family glucarate transporter-like MFS transporter
VTDRRGAWWLVGLLFATAAASYLCRVNVSVAGALMMKEFGLSQVVMGRVFSAFLLGYALFQVPAGMLADRYGARRVLAGAALWWVAGTAVLAAIGWGPLALGAEATMTALLAVRFVIGVGEAPTFPAAAQAVARWIPPTRRGRANGLVIAAIGVGSAIAPPLVSAVMVRWGWRAALLVSAVPALAAGLAWLVAKEPRGPGFAGETSGIGAPTGRLGSRSFVLLTLSYTLQGYVGYIFVFWFYLYLVDVRHFDLLRGALFGSLPWVLSMVSIPLGGIISDRLVESRLGLNWGRRLVPLAAFIGAGVFLALGAHTTHAHLAAVCLALATALVVGVEGPFWATMMELAGRRSGAAGGVMNMGSNLGGLVSPALTPVLAARMGWENALHVAAVIALLGGLLWFGIAASHASSQRDE